VVFVSSVHSGTAQSYGIICFGKFFQGALNLNSPFKILLSRPPDRLLTEVNTWIVDFP
jgi:hypothetical protein